VKHTTAILHARDLKLICVFMCVLTRDVNSSLQFVVKWSSSVEMPWIARFLRLKSSGLSVLTGLPIDRDTSNANTVGILNINLEELSSVK